MIWLYYTSGSLRLLLLLYTYISRGFGQMLSVYVFWIFWRRSTFVVVLLVFLLVFSREPNCCVMFLGFCCFAHFLQGGFEHTEQIFFDWTHLPFTVTFCSLQSREHSAWLRPPKKRGKNTSNNFFFWINCTFLGLQCRRCGSTRPRTQHAVIATSK